MKVDVIRLQCLPEWKLPYVVICGRPQTNYQVNAFGDVVMEVARNAVQKVEGGSS